MENIANSSTEKVKSSKSKNTNTNVRFRRQNFSVKETFLLLQLLKEVQLTSKRSDQNGNFTPDDWKEIHPKYNEKCNGTKRNEDELRARYKTVKKNFHIYKELADRTGWSWNYDESLPLAPSREAWAEVFKENKKYKGYQKRTFPWYKAMEDLCGTNGALDAHNANFDLEMVNGSQNSDNHQSNEEELDGFQLNLTPRQEFEQDGNKCDFAVDPPNDIIPPVNIQEGQIEELDGNQSQTEPQIEPRATSSFRKNKIEAIKGECSKNKRKRSNATENENLLQKSIEQTDRFIEIQKERNVMLSQFVTNKPDPNEICREVIKRLNSNGINLGPNELTNLVVTLSNPWIRAVFMNIEGNQLKDWITNMLAPSNLITRRMMTWDMESDVRSYEDDARFIAEMMDDDHIYVHLKNTNMLMLSMMSSFSNFLGKNKSQKRSRRS